MSTLTIIDHSVIIQIIAEIINFCSYFKGLLLHSYQDLTVFDFIIITIFIERKNSSKLESEALVWQGGEHS